VKKTYRVRNWGEYEAGLRERGSLIVWISLTDGKLANWDAPRPKNMKPGRGEDRLQDPEHHGGAREARQHSDRMKNSARS